MKISVPYNWDIDLLNQLAGLNIHEIFASGSLSLLGSGRSKVDESSTIRLEDMEKHVRFAQKKGIQFNYLINSVHIPQMISDKDIVIYLKQIEGLSADIVTIAHPRIIELAYNNIRTPIKISVNTHISNPATLKEYPFCLAERINVDTVLNRDFSALEKFRNIDMSVELLVNEGCIHHCPDRNQHNEISSKLSSSQFESSDVQKHLVKREKMIMCVAFKKRLENLSHLIKACWIRPEDVEEYEKLGIDYIKIGGREYKSEWILNATKAYSSKKYAGNLLDIVYLCNEKQFYSEIKMKDFQIDNSVLSQYNFLNMIRHAKSKEEYDEICSFIADKAVVINNQELYMDKINEKLSGKVKS